MLWYFDMSELLVSCFNVIPHLETPDHYLLVEETDPQGFFNLTGGNYDPDDKILPKGAEREATEESELITKAIGGIGLYQYPPNRLHVIFAAVVVSGEPVASEEHPTAAFFPYDEIVAMEAAGILRGPAVLRSIDFHRQGKIIDLDQFHTFIERDRARDPAIPADR